ncbi:MAG: hypothetical protein E6I33_11310 [Chloroflexi bacterium]|nr:MAG: hypothetical protein E6I33_11310 [Chloroflexota bacterium]
MSARGVVRRGRRGQAGLSLIEVAATVFLLGVAVVALVAGLATTQRSAAIASGQTKLEAAARQMGDFLRTPDDGSAPKVAYQLCDAHGTQPDTYKTAVISGLPPMFNTSWNPKIIEVAEATSASLTQDPTYSTEPELTCSDGNTDWGVQRITFSVTDATTNRTLVRAVFKWDPNAGSHPIS